MEALHTLNLIISAFLSLLGTDCCRALPPASERHHHHAESLSPAFSDISYETLHYPTAAHEELQYGDAIVPAVISTGRRIPFVSPGGTGRTTSRGRKSRDDGSTVVDTRSSRKPIHVRPDPNATKTESRRRNENAETTRTDRD